MGKLGRRARTGALILPLALFATGCVSPESDLKDRRRKAEAQSLQTLYQEFRLPPPPPSELTVSKKKASAPGSFRLLVKEPGWDLDGPLEPIRATKEAGLSDTVFSWELPAERVASWTDSPDRTPPLLLHLWKGPDHRPVVIPCMATKGRPGEWAGTILMGGLAIVAAPIWLPSWLLITPFEESRIAKQHQHLVWPQPGNDAPASYPEGLAPFSTRLEANPPGQPRLVITVIGAAWAPCEGTLLDTIRQAVGCFQPDLAAGITEDPSQPGTFIVPLPPGELGRARPLLLLSRNCAAGRQEGDLWALYFSSKGDWVKAWRLYRGPRAGVGQPPAAGPPGGG